MGIVIKFEIEESLLTEIDEVATTLGITRVVYMTTAIKHALRHHRPRELSAEDEANTFRLWLLDDADDADGFDAPDRGPEDDRLN